MQNIFRTMNTKYWTSGNNQIDEIIRASQRRATDNEDRNHFLEWINIHRFSNIRYISSGAFGDVSYAIWFDGPPIDVERVKRGPPCDVAIKFFDSITEFMKELIHNHKMIEACSSASGFGNLIHVYGVTRGLNGNYGIVMQYASEGSLDSFLKNNWRYISWEIKLGILKDIARGLKNLHDAGLIHGDLHCNNIMITRDRVNYSITAYIGDFGFTRSEERYTNRTQIVGVIPFIAPEVLAGKKYTKKADIFSFGVLMYQIVCNKKPFFDQNHNFRLARSIYEGLRPQFNRDLMPICYETLMRNCWNYCQRSRPKSEKLYEKFSEWESSVYERDSPFEQYRLIAVPLPNKCDHQFAVYTTRVWHSPLAHSYSKKK
ncbi:kinase-like domain-containing protein [Rhizophagus irregularis DAOM 181602=DAOM 197198]|nr:kinase-like domain-containing protein [Rhizophagus irregularis DAOM 181602=DAOM 197198]POG68733.1 kinase-like domain-containing protein [Rhizophagus irregularis DAOM 181602=DAOM 197198]|eukprot:XP_025175599.1 kinase-like domain-containing protein [Rhizophagus irregularis DAOM 181602=DAOM 197198]